MKLLLSLLGSILLCSCGPSARETPDSSGASNPGTPDASRSFPDGPDTTESRVYAHTSDHLYRFDTVTNTPQEIGQISGLQARETITDIAVDKTERIIGISYDRLYNINKDTAAATLIKDLPASAKAKSFTSLTFVPRDINNTSSEERLIAATNDGEVFEISATTGEVTPVGSYGMMGSKKIGSSGDIVAVYGAGIFATVNIGTTSAERAKPDYLVKLNPSTFEATLPPSDTGMDKIFGLAYWKGKVYGFVDMAGASAGGQFVELNPTTGSATVLTSGQFSWFGAGVTTVAPLVE
jgi:hypothetical protein